jgi:hypothetical protein
MPSSCVRVLSTCGCAICLLGTLIRRSAGTVYALSKPYSASRVKWYIFRSVYELYVVLYLSFSAICRLVPGAKVRGPSGEEPDHTGEDARTYVRDSAESNSSG